MISILHLICAFASENDDMMRQSEERGTCPVKLVASRVVLYWAQAKLNELEWIANSFISLACWKVRQLFSILLLLIHLLPFVRECLRVCLGATSKSWNRKLKRNRRHRSFKCEETRRKEKEMSWLTPPSEATPLSLSLSLSPFLSLFPSLFSFGSFSGIALWRIHWWNNRWNWSTTDSWKTKPTRQISKPTPCSRHNNNSNWSIKLVAHSQNSAVTIISS